MQSKTKICQADFLKELPLNMIHPFNSTVKFIIGFTVHCTVGFQGILTQRLAFPILENWIVHALNLSAHLCVTMSWMWENKSRLELFYCLFICLLCQILLTHKLKHMLEWSLKPSLRKPKWFRAFQVLRWFSFLFRVACISLERTTNTGM